MQANIIHIGLDVDDTNYHGSALGKHSGESLSFKCRPTLKGLLNQLHKLQKQFPDTAFHLCYEVSYIGYTLQRDLSNQGYHCDVRVPVLCRTRQEDREQPDSDHRPGPDRQQSLRDRAGGGESQRLQPARRRCSQSASKQKSRGCAATSPVPESPSSVCQSPLRTRCATN